jgi:hypothetical protein
VSRWVVELTCGRAFHRDVPLILELGMVREEPNRCRIRLGARIRQKLGRPNFLSYPQVSMSSNDTECYNTDVHRKAQRTLPGDDNYQLITSCMTPPKIAAGVAFDPDVLEYLRRLCAEFRRDRSYMINAIVRDHAQQQQARPRPRKRERAIHF